MVRVVSYTWALGPDPEPRADLLPGVTADLARRRSKGVRLSVARRGPLPGEGVALTRRQSQVLALIACGDSNEDIAGALRVSVATVKFHARDLFDRLGARDRAHAVALGYQLGLLPLDAA
jgi:ATP/maltotriose-dependent transcriptional regulator MalT